MRLRGGGIKKNRGLGYYWLVPQWGNHSGKQIPSESESWTYFRVEFTLSVFSFFTFLEGGVLGYSVVLAKQIPLDPVTFRGGGWHLCVLLYAWWGW